MPFKNLDQIKEQKTQIMQRLSAAVKENDSEAFAEAFNELAENIQQAVLAEAQGMIGAVDSQILSGRGVRQLTSQENAYYQKVLAAMKAPDPKQAVTMIDDVMPTTIIDTIFADIESEHPLLALIDFQNTGALAKIILGTSGGVAAWGALTATIASELTGGFAILSLEQAKLSAFVPVAKAMLDLGPVWMDRYARALLGEALATQLEAGIVDGNGKDQPLGMTRALTGAIDGEYPRKTSIVVTSFDPITLGTLCNTISQGPNSKRRAIPQLVMVVNPADYYTKVFPATTIRTADGTFRKDVFPFPTTVVVSDSVPEGNAVIGLAKRYFMGLGTSQGGKLEFSDEYKFLEDVRTYLIKLYGNGRPLDANAFLLLDISGVQPAIHEVRVDNFADIAMVYPADARLASLAVGELTLDPAFNKSVMAYTAATTDATNTVAAIAKDGDATIAIEVNGDAHVNGAAATWEAGPNTVEVTVTIGTATETYSVVVTKS